MVKLNNRSLGRTNFREGACRKLVRAAICSSLFCSTDVQPGGEREDILCKCLHEEHVTLLS